MIASKSYAWRDDNAAIKTRYNRDEWFPSPQWVTVSRSAGRQTPHDEDDYEDTRTWRELQEDAITSRLGRPLRLGADWGVTTWALYDNWYLSDNEDDSYSVIRRWYLDDDYAGLPEKYRDWADGHNDAFVEIATFQDPKGQPVFDRVMQWLDKNLPTISGHSGGAQLFAALQQG